MALMRARQEVMKAVYIGAAVVIVLIAGMILISGSSRLLKRPCFLEACPSSEEFDPARFALCVNSLIRQGPSRGYRVLRDAANHKSTQGSFERQQKLLLLCRAIYISEPEAELQAPQLGRPLGVPFLSMQGTNWPCFPLVIVRGMPLLLGEKYIFRGTRLPVADYLEYCREYGRFRQSPFAVLSKMDAEAALDELFLSERWQRVVWEAHSDDTLVYRCDEAALKGALQLQIRRCGKRKKTRVTH